MTNKISEKYFDNLKTDEVFELITSVDSELKATFDSYLFKEYGNDSDSRLYYIDVAEISRFIVNKIKVKQLDFLKEVFIKIEQILLNCDKEIEDLIVIGLFESIQNIGGTGIDYHFGFDNWLLPLSKTKWDALIDVWESSNWRNKS